MTCWFDMASVWDTRTGARNTAIRPGPAASVEAALPVVFGSFCWEAALERASVAACDGGVFDRGVGEVWPVVEEMMDGRVVVGGVFDRGVVAGGLSVVGVVGGDVVAEELVVAVVDD